MKTQTADINGSHPDTIPFTPVTDAVIRENTGRRMFGWDVSGPGGLLDTLRNRLKGRSATGNPATGGTGADPYMDLDAAANQATGYLITAALLGVIAVMGSGTLPVPVLVILTVTGQLIRRRRGLPVRRAAGIDHRGLTALPRMFMPSAHRHPNLPSGFVTAHRAAVVFLGLAVVTTTVQIITAVLMYLVR